MSNLRAEQNNPAECPYSNRQSKDEKPTAAPTQLLEIPQPPQHLFGLLGNIPDIDPSFPFKEIWRLQKLYGPIMKLKLNEDRIFIGSQELVNELCDPKRFHKAHSNVLEETRAMLGDGLFTAYHGEPNWAKAHRMLVPTFGPMGIRKMWSGMQDIASQMVLKWDRLGPENEIVCADDLTRLAFDTIGLCAFSYRFNQFYSEAVHPFARRMGEVLKESGRKANRPSIAQPLYRTAEQQRQDKIKAMWDLCDKVISERKEHPQPENTDLLNVMLQSVDKETGEGLSDDNIRMQLCTFLVAGHETTSATLSFTYHNLLKNPDKLLKAQKQVDEVVGDNVVTLDHVPKLDYIDACLKETLRLNSPINGSSLCSEKDEILGGKYFIPANTTVTWVSQVLHKDPKVWGDDADTYRPERFLNGGFQNLPPNSWKPFGTGARACIGRAFAEQEMIMNVAMVLQRFQIELADPGYELELKSTLTIKPKDFKIKVRRRQGKDINVGIPGGALQHNEHHKKTTLAPAAAPKGEGKPLAIYFGGNSGTCEGMAHELEAAAQSYGFQSTISSLDSATERVPTDRPVVIITSSYEGQPPDNAKKFVSWLEGLQQDNQTLKGVKFTVFGVGNSDWASTFHRIPKLVDELVASNGGSKIIDAGLTNVKADLTGPWEEWSENLLKALAGTEAVAKSKVEATVQRNPLGTSAGSSDKSYGTVLVNQEIADAEIGPAKRHLEIRLPEGTEYQAGDYLVVQPHNPREAVHRALAFFSLSEDDYISISGSSKKHLPTEPTLAGRFLGTAVELASPVTKRQLETIAAHAQDRDGEAKAMLDRHSELVEKRYSVLDVIEEYAISLPFGEYLDMLPALVARQYSISSSALKHPDTASLTIDVLEAPAFSGHGTFQGVASTYLASRRPGDTISCFVRPTNVGFRYPTIETPIIMISAGTGVAPMRAFLQERSAIAEAGTQKLAPAILYFGCRHEDKDFIYKDELKQWEQMGIVKVRTAFSKTGDAEHHYVPDLIWENKEETARLFQDGGKIFLCGSAARLGKSTADVCKKIYMERPGKTQEEADKWLESVRTSRYVSDVY